MKIIHNTTTKTKTNEREKFLPHVHPFVFNYLCFVWKRRQLLLSFLYLRDGVFSSIKIFRSCFLFVEFIIISGKSAVSATSLILHSAREYRKYCYPLDQSDCRKSVSHAISHNNTASVEKNTYTPCLTLPTDIYLYFSPRKRRRVLNNQRGDRRDNFPSRIS